MKQILQSLKNGTTSLEEIPVPNYGSGELLIRSRTSLVSAGTERMLVQFGRSGWVSKARQQPDKVREVIEKARSNGVVATYEAVQSKLDQPLALGYCNAGHVVDVGSATSGFSVGDRVISNGNHAEFVTVGQKLCAKIPDNVTFEESSFVVIGAIGLQGIRLIQPTLGECFVVTGLGLVGLLTVQMLLAQGCRVLGIDFDENRLKLAREFGAETVNPDSGDVVTTADTFSRGRGVDGVLITASTDSNKPVHQAAQMCRKRGRIVLVGVTGLDLSRDDFFEKELTFQVSCSYGPGRYDPAYEVEGVDYPVGFVRWTEQRNFEAVLDLMAAGALNVQPLISHRFEIDQACSAMDLLTSKESSLGILINYPETVANEVHKKLVILKDTSAEPGKGNVAFIGAGNYASRVLIPAFKSAGANLSTVVSEGGVSAVYSGKKYGFTSVATDFSEVLENKSIDTVVIATRHDSHAKLVLDSLQAGKHVFCEKPLCLDMNELAAIESEKKSRPEQHLMVGFNRRFAPHIKKFRSLLKTIDQPKNLILTINAGHIPEAHWVQDKLIGGGRIIGEGCHFIDLLRLLVGHPIVSSHAVALGEHPAVAIRDDKAVITLQFADGSVGVIHYLANGHNGVAKERLEVFTAGRVLKLDNFVRMSAFGWSKVRSLRLWRQDKGQNACASAFIDSIKSGGVCPIPLDQIIESSRVSIEVGNSLR